MGARLRSLVVAALGAGFVLAVAGCSSRSSDPHPGEHPVPPAVPVAADQPAPVVNGISPDDPTINAVRGMLDEPLRGNARLIGRTVEAGAQRLTLLYVVGEGLCIPEGCDLFVFRRNGEAFEQVGDIGFVHLPVRLLASTTNGMPNLGITVTVDGGSGNKLGVPPKAPHEVLLPFLNAHYVAAPADYGARPSGNPAGTVVIAAEDRPLPHVIAPPDPALHAWVRAFEKGTMAPLHYATASWGEGDGRITFVHMIGPGYCGTGGCTLLVLQRRGGTFDLLGEISTVSPPVRVLPSATKGRPDLAIRTRGPGVSLVDKLIPFNGRRYAWSPNLPVARDIANPGGQIVLDDDTPWVTVRE